MRKKVFVGLSGGVDSAVSAALLKRDGYDVTGVFIRIALDGYPCPAAQDRIEAMRVAAHLQIPFREIDLSRAYQERVFAHTLEECAHGRTPNPDVLCNREIKFGLFYEYAMAHSADYIATGHYARVQSEHGSTVLKKGVDDSKDQSYFLWMVPEAHLQRTLFPVGDKKKTEVRVLAKKFDLPNAIRKDSQGLCFLGDVSLSDMLSRELHPEPGEVLSEDGQVVGEHGGVALYTLGQRHGFTLHAQMPEAKPQYVIAKNAVHNTLTVSEDPFPRGAGGSALELVDTNWIGQVPNGVYSAQFRYHQTLISAQLERHDTRARVVLAEPQYVPLGQSLVLYEGDRCLGGGVIDRADVLISRT